ncbi:MAG: TetR family transcriptional regulator [Verrucomicrobiota bacterium]
MKAERSSRSASRNPHQSQERILDAALREFAAKGFAGARVDAIARRARINKRMLYHYFGDKDRLFREVLRRKLSERSAWLASAPEDAGDSLAYWFRLACNDIDWVRLLEWEALQGDSRELIEEEHRRVNVRRAIDRLRRQQAEGLLPSEYDPGQLLLTMMSLTAYPLAFPQLTRLITGMEVSDPAFQAQREKFLRLMGRAIRRKPREGAPGTD